MARMNFAEAMKADNELFKSNQNTKSRDEILKEMEAEKQKTVMENNTSVVPESLPTPTPAPSTQQIAFAPTQQKEFKPTSKLYVEISTENYKHLKRESGALGMQLKDYVDQIFDYDRTQRPHHYMD